MFGIGLPEMILILALALIVVGPDKLPELARSLAKGIMELKKTAEGFKEQIKTEGNILDDVRPDLENAAKTFKSHMLDHPDKGATSLFPADANTGSADHAAKAYEELTQAGVNPGVSPADAMEPAAKVPTDLTEAVVAEKAAADDQPIQDDNNPSSAAK